MILMDKLLKGQQKWERDRRQKANETQSEREKFRKYERGDLQQSLGGDRKGFLGSSWKRERSDKGKNYGIKGLRSLDGRDFLDSIQDNLE